MPEKLSNCAEACDCTTPSALTVDPDTWLDEALADSFPASDPLATHRFN
ncbi:MULTISPECIES: hypothetical protein [Methylobacterium]|jgi:hypothetical protein|nr:MULTISPECIES: hypothetical protein [Methylobacterium]